MMTNNPISIIQAMKISIEVHKQQSIDAISKTKGISREEASLIIDEGKGLTNDFYSGWNIGSLHGYISALDDVIDAISKK